MADTLKPVQDLVDESGGVDATKYFELEWELLGELADKVFARFELTRDPSTEQFETYSGNGGAAGQLRAYSGPEVDWAVHSHIGNPAYSFSNMHLTVWLGPQVKVPHLGIAFATFPQVWGLLDYTPRSDLMIDLDSLDRYYQPVNEEWLESRVAPAVSPFESRALYVREALSETAHCWLYTDADTGIAHLRELAHNHVDRWLRWIDEAERVPAERRPALAERDETIRRNIAERDPANVMGVRLFGEERADALVRALWGGNRVLPRPS